ncbi:MAG: ABC transporter permease [Bacteroidales bacterium]|jgi:ABC-2 type transport system permease protein|nr:ABC transporter permease [Bacteroidales bacterium]
MHKIRSLLIKEFLLLFRDIPGLIILFVMPVLLIFVVTLAQENAVKVQHLKTPVLWADETHSLVTEKIVRNIEASGFFKIVKKIDQNEVTPSSALKLIGKGDYQFGVIITTGDSSIGLIIDPTLQETYRIASTQSLTYLIREAQARDAMDKLIQKLAGSMKPVIDQMLIKTMNDLPPIKETFALKEKSSIQPSVIQNNVPGFILFAMFFIVIPLAGSLITEKNEGSFRRLMTLPVHLTSLLTAKVITYLIVCLIQFSLMIGVGCWIFPVFFGLPSFETGHQYLAIFMTTFAASLAAIGFGLLVGTLSSTQNQAALFGSVMVVILGVISGTFFPIHLMPDPIRYISYLSPVRWGIDNYLDLFIRDGNVITILPKTILLFLFFGFAMTISIATFAKKY